MRRTRINMNYLSYLLNIFDGKISYSELINMPLSRLTALQRIKEKELEERSKNLKNMKDKKENQQMTINNSGKKFRDKTMGQ